MRRSLMPRAVQTHVTTVESGLRLSECLVSVTLAACGLLVAGSMCSSSRPDEAQPVPASAPKPHLSRMIRAMAIHPDDQALVFAWNGGRCIEWNLASHREARSADLSADLPADATVTTLSGNGRTWLTGSVDGSVCIFRNGQRDRVLVLDDAIVLMACSGDGRYAAIAGDTSLVVWSIEFRRPLLTRSGFASPIARLALSGDGTRLAVVHADHAIELRDPPSPAVICRLRASHPVALAWLSTDGSRLATSDPWGGLSVHEIPAGRVCLHDPPRQPSDVITAAAFSPDGRLLACGRIGGGLELWDIQTGTRQGEWPGHERPVSALCFSFSGERLFSTSCDTAVRVWDAAEQDERPCIDLSGLVSAHPAP